MDVPTWATGISTRCGKLGRITCNESLEIILSDITAIRGILPVVERAIDVSGKCNYKGSLPEGAV